MTSRADKPEAQGRAKAVQRQFPIRIEELGFTRSQDEGFTRGFGEFTARVGLQKFRHQAALRVIFSVVERADTNAKPHREFSDRWTYRDGPGPKKYDFGIEWGDDAVDRCLDEITHFVQRVVVPCAETHSTQQNKG
jgi:hypothetical protein